MRMGKKMWIIRFTAAALLIVSGCSSPTSSFYEPENTKDQTTEKRLTFFGFKYEALNVQAIEKALHGYMDKHTDTNIMYEGIKGIDYYDILGKRITTGHTDDIFMVDQATVLKLEKYGKLADLSDLSTIDDFSDLVKSQMLVDGKVNYIPTTISAFGLYCNEDLLKKYKQKIPENLEEFMQVCDFFVKKGITPIIANNDISLKTIAIGKGMYSIYQKKDSAKQMEQFNRGETDLAAALQPGFDLVETMLKRGYVDVEQTLKTEKTKDDLTDFAKGRNPFMLTGAWAAPRLRDLNLKFTFSIHPYPILTDGSVMVMNIDTRIAVNAESTHVQEAKRFVEYLTQKDVMWEFVNSLSSFSPLDEERNSDDPAISSMSPYMENGRSVLGSDDNLDYPIWNLTRTCVEKLLKGASSAEVTSQLRDQLKQLREESGNAD